MVGKRRPSLSPFACEDGFTIIEVMVAAAVLLVGLVGVLGMVSKADAVSASNRAREQGIALQREIVEAARSVTYDQLTQANIVNRIRGTAGLTDSLMTASGWTYVRRNVNYSVAVGTCSVDDPSDGTGPHESAGYCLDGTGSTTPAQCLSYLGRNGDIAGNGTAGGVAVGDCGIDLNRDGTVDGLVDTAGGPCTNCSGNDKNPNDYKRIVVLVRWSKGFGTRYALQSTTLPNPGLAAAPAITSFTPASAKVGYGDPQTLSFTLGFNTPPAAVPWYVDGTATGQATGSGLIWSFPWDLGQVNYTDGGRPNASEILDGTYAVSAKGVDTYGQAGTTKAATVIVNRRRPYAPTNVHAGRNGNTGYIEWGANAERDVQGYDVYRVGVSSPVCSLVHLTRCKDTGLPATAAQYYVRAVDLDSTGNQREGDPTANVSVPAAAVDGAPSPVPNFTGLRINGTVILSWQPASDPDSGSGDSIQYYRIYRDGTDWVDNFYGQTPGPSTLQFTDTQPGSDPHTYFVVAVDQSFTEGPPGSGLTR